MDKKIFWCHLYILISLMSSCRTYKDQIIQEKNKCYDMKVKKLQTALLYKQVHSQFKDTLELLKEEKKYFGIPEYVEVKIDDAIFFKKDSSECLLIVLKRSRDTLVFGSARMIRGYKSNGRWVFDVSMNYSFAKDYFNLYRENSFENISKLARYSVLTDGNIKRRGCEIDDYYWFVQMKK